MEGSGHEAFDALYEQFRTPVFHLALAIVKDPAAAEDVMQEAFIAAYTTLAHGPIHHFRSWILKVTRNRALNLVRDQRFETPCELPTWVEPTGSQEDQVLDHLMLAKVLRSISQEEHLIFTLHCLDGYTYREIAAVLEMPIGTVQTRCHIAKKKLKAALAAM